MKKINLHKHMIINVIITPLVILLITAFIVITVIGGTMENLINEKTQISIQVLEREIHHYFEHPTDEINIVTDILTSEENPLAEHIDMMIGYFQYLNHVDIINTEGIIVHSYPSNDGRVGFDMSNNTIYLHARSTNEDIFYGEMIFDPQSGLNTLYLISNIEDQYVVGYVDLEIFEELFQEMNVIDSKVGIFDNNGTYISHTDINLVNQRSIDPMFKDIVSGQLVTGDEVKLDGELYILHYIEIPPYNWHIVYYQNLASIESVIFQSILTQALSFGVLIFVLLFIMTRTVRNLDKSIQQLMIITTMISQGNYELPDATIKFEEIHELFNSIMDMSQMVETRETEISGLTKELEENYYTMVVLLAKAIEAKDNYTGNHCERVRDFSLNLANGLHLSKEEIRQLKFGSTLHDIGKLGIPESILNKPGQFTDKEFEQIKMHSSLGYSIMAQLPAMQSAKQIILHHHERVDGNGYPYGLKGEEIPLLARIVSIADAFDAMTSARPYRQKYMTYAEAFEELEKHSGTQFDAKLVNIFIKEMKKAIL